MVNLVCGTTTKYMLLSWLDYLHRNKKIFHSTELKSIANLCEFDLSDLS